MKLFTNGMFRLVLNSGYAYFRQNHYSQKGLDEAYHMQLVVSVGTDLFYELSALHAYMERLIKEPKQQIPWAGFRN